MAKERTVRDIMNTPVITIKENSRVTDAIKLMASQRINGLPVLDDTGKLVGMITGRLIMNNAISGNARSTNVAEVMSKDLETYGPVYSLNTAVEEIVNRFAASRINRILILEYGKVVGIISRIDIMREIDRIYSELYVSQET
jgi:CBS domain-containing protein